MLGRIFGKRGRQAVSDQQPQTNTVNAAFECQRQKDPLFDAKMGAKAVLEGAIEDLKDERGVHVETLLATLGALSGFACPASVAAEAHRKGVTAQQLGVMLVGTKDGRQFWAGAGVNAPLLTNNPSVWSLIGGMAQHLGVVELQDMQELVGRVTATLGSPAFGEPDIPENHRAGMLPIECVKLGWPKSDAIRKECPPEQWPIMFALAAQQALQMSTKSIATDIAMRIVMEYAVPMSRLDPERVG